MKWSLYLHSIPQSNYVKQRWRLCASGPSCQHVRHLAHSILFPTRRKNVPLTLPLGTANTPVKTLYSHSDHFTIMLLFFWWNCKNPKYTKSTWRHEMSVSKIYLMIFISSPKKSLSVNSQSLPFFQYYCSLLNSVCSRVGHSMEAVTTVTALYGDTLIQNISCDDFP